MKDGPGTLQLTATNSYNGNTTILSGALQATFGAGIPSSSYLVLNGGVLETTGRSLTRTCHKRRDNFQWGVNGGGFSAHGGELVVNIGGQSTPSSSPGAAADVG